MVMMTSHYSGRLGLIILVGLLAQGANLLTAAIYIDGAPERTVPAGSSFLLSCHANETVFWRHPLSSDAHFSRATKKTPTGYNALLTVESSDYLATGFYECFGDSGEASVYVFVRDDDHLLAVDSSETLLLGHQYRDLIVPCKPTSPDVNVTLSYHDKPVNFYKYDPKVGFTIPNITLLDSGYVSCMGFRGGKEESEEFTLSINPASETAPQPEIVEDTIQRVVVGQDVTLHCLVQVELGLTFALDWVLPESANLSGRYVVGKTINRSVPEEGSEETLWEKSLTLSRVVKSDEGNYTCRIIDHSSNINSDTKYLRIYSENDSFINVTVQSRSIEVDATLDNPTAKWVVTINAHPNVEVSWYQPDETEITMSMSMKTKYRMRQANAQTVLEIHDVTVDDAGNYTLIATNSGGTEAVTLELIVLDKPEVFFHDLHFYHIDVPTNVSCFVKGYPPPFIYWTFQRCNFTQKMQCGEFEMVSGKSQNIFELQISEAVIESTIEWNMEEPGQLSCTAVNEKGNDTAILPIYVTDVPERFLFGRTPGDIVEGDNLTLACGANSYEYWGYPTWWFFPGNTSNPVPVDRNLILEESENYSFWSRVQIPHVDSSHSGKYICRAHERANFTVREESTRVDVLKAEAPAIETNLPDGEMTIASWQPLTWTCNVTGVPQPSISWYKDGELLTPAGEFSNYEILDGNRSLTIKSLTVEEEGEYVCRAMNKKGFVDAFVRLRLKENHKTNTTLIITVVVVAVLFVIALFSIFYAMWRIAKERRELRLAGLQYFKEGMTKSINQELTLDQQTDLLPYDPKWEFPSSKLKLGKQLGAGAFGVVLKAEAYGIVENEESTTVAVKMVKRHADPAYIRALVSELKILAHLGKHLNVVNLLGACTKNYMKRELLVIVEFCKYGNAHNYLSSHRHRFIDQIDPVTGEIDITKRSTIDSCNRSSVDSDPNSALTSFNTEMTCLSSERSVENSLNSGSNNNPEWCANLQGDYKRYDLDELSTSTLVCWSFQVARGMEYLASRRVLHGDLAARNVLIAENNIVKICDFGFAKNIYSSPEYQGTGDGPVPVKWMAIESITRRIFSTQSDVWSFGIVLWEFFSLARTPYPGFENYESILNKLETGYRMEKPLYANQTLYDIMLECWDQQPCRRPSFSELVMKLGKLLESNVREHYIDLNAPFQKQAIPEGEDYLSMMSPPNYDSSAPHYVNEPFGKQNDNQNADGYVCMRSSWSSKNAGGEGGGGGREDNIEMKPMLSEKDKNDSNNDDYLIPRQVPANSDCAFNPSYIMSSKASSKQQSQYGKINRT